MMHIKLELVILFFFSLFVFGFYIYRNLKRELEFRRQLQLDLTREKNKFEALFNNSSDANAIVVDGKYVLCNEGCLELYKRKAEEIIGKTPEELSPLYQPDGELSSVKVQHILSEMVAKGHMRFQWMHSDADGQPIWCDIIITKIIYNGQMAIYSQLRNINDMKNLEASLIKLKLKAEQANVAKSQFLANMSHEIRTPMNAVMGFTEMLEASEGLSHEQLGYVKSIKTGAKSLLQIINDILDLSKIEAGKLQIKAQPFNIIHFLEEIRTVFATSIHNKGLTFTIEVPQNMPVIWVMDDVRLRQILFNLIGNAIKFTDTGGITVALILDTFDQENQLIDVTLKVIDTGIGISSNDRNKVFDDFEQSDGQDTRKYGGTGLGLAITKKLSALMGGDIHLKSELGTGSEFSVSFKRVPYETTPIIETSVAKEVIYTFKPATILSVDDVELNLLLIRNRLSKYPFEIIDAANGEEALKKLQLHRIDLILLDLQMPVMDGYALKQRLNENPEFNTIPVIALTAAVSDVDKQKLEGLKFNSVLSKPLSNEELLHGISQFLPCSQTNPTTDTIKEEKSLEFEHGIQKVYDDTFAAILKEEQLTHNFAKLGELAEELNRFLSEYPNTLLKHVHDELEHAIRRFDVIEIERLLHVLRENLQKEAL